MGGPHFSDVPVGSTFYQYIETLYNMGLVGGYPDGTFRPGSFVTRGQISKIVVSAAVATDPAHWLLLNPANNTFDDVLPGSTFYKYVETAATHNILSGYPCGVSPAGPCGALHKPYFITNNNTTRAQISKIVYLAVGP
jgi:S-layer family protein